MNGKQISYQTDPQPEFASTPFILLECILVLDIFPLWTLLFKLRRQFWASTPKKDRLITILKNIRDQPDNPRLSYAIKFFEFNFATCQNGLLFDNERKIIK